MLEAYAKLIERHRTILNYWDQLEPGPAGAATLAASRLARSRVLLIASGPVGYLAAANLAQLPLAALSLVGVHRADMDVLHRIKQQPQCRAGQINVTSDRFDIPGFSITLARHHILVVASGRPYPEILEQVNMDCLRIGTAWTQIGVCGAEMILGPTIIPGVTACYDCYIRRYRANLENQDAWEARDHFLRVNPTFEFQGQIAPLLSLSAAYLTAEVARFLTGEEPPLALSQAATFYPLAQTRSFDFVVPVEWCPVCYDKYQRPEHQQADTLSEMVKRTLERQEVVHAAG